MITETDKNKRQIVIYLQVRLPRRLRMFQNSEVRGTQNHFDDELNERLVKRAAQDAYMPMNELLFKLIVANPEIRLSLSIAGETLALLEKYSPEALESFVKLSMTGAVEFLGETYYHSLASLFSAEEFQSQVVLHSESVYRYFGLRPTVFRNTELIYNDEIGSMISRLGFKAVICDGSLETLGSRVPDLIYNHPEEELSILPHNADLSNAISVRFGAGEKALTVEKFLLSLAQIESENAVTIFGFNYEIFADHHNRDAGMVSFFTDLLTEIAHHAHYKLSTASEVLSSGAVRPKLSIPQTTACSEDSKGLTNFLGNDMQQEAFELLRVQADKVYRIADETVIDAWRSFQASEHFAYMATGTMKTSHYLEPYTQYPSPYEAFINYMNTMNDFSLNISNAPMKEPDDEHSKTIESERQHPRIPLWAMQKESQQPKAPELSI